MTKQIFSSLLIGIVLFCLPYSVKALDEGTDDIQWGGYLQTDNRMRIKDDKNFSWHEYRLDLKAEVNPMEKAHFYSEIC